MIKKGLLLLFFLTLIGCSVTKTMNFFGETNNWYVNYWASKNEKQETMLTISIRYIGENPSPERIKYLLKGSTLKLEGEAEVKDSKINIVRDSCSGCTFFEKDEDIITTITWNGQSETIKLKSQR